MTEQSLSLSKLMEYQVNQWTAEFKSYSSHISKENKAMFVSRNSFSGKPLSKFSCVCLPLGKLVNGKHFPVNGNTFRSTENTFRSKKNLV